MQRYLLVLLCLLLPGATLAAASTQQLQLLVEQKKFVKAVNEGNDILQQDPTDARARFLTAYSYQMTAITDKAISLYQGLIRDHPTLPEPRNNLAMIYLEQGDYDRASQMLVSAINTRIGYAIAYANLSQVYKSIASEAYRRAISQSTEPAEYTHDIELTAITWLDIQNPATAPQIASLTVSKPVQEEQLAKDIATTQSVVNAANEDTRLIEKVRNWALAWSSKDFDNYRESYATGYRDKFNTHEQWIKHRRERIVRPGKIKVEVSDFAVRQRGTNRASVNFTQAFSSPSYSDRVVKRLDFERVGSQWKIAAERVISVL
ncbi:MAG: tetratricopeptide repeat protein [Gammaproteobacteria bacterium]|nr:tetratricopeptide repeat protein [Gammaproteobacteria bacterium]